MELCAEPVAQPCREIAVKYVSSHCVAEAEAGATYFSYLNIIR
jgi:hypothetical protein